MRDCEWAWTGGGGDSYSESILNGTLNNTSGELGSAFPGSLVGEYVFRAGKSASWLPLVSVVPE